MLIASRATHHRVTKVFGLGEDRMRYLTWMRYVVAVGLTAGTWVAASLEAAELVSPYSLPSQTRITADQRSLSSIAPSNSSSNETYYRDFAQKSRQLQLTQRKQLLASLSGRREEALRAGNVIEAQHYYRLYEIVNATGFRSQ